MDRPKLSIVVPIYNEEENISELYDRLSLVLEKLCCDIADKYEIILVDDGSKDHSWVLIEQFHRKDSRVKGLSFSRNFGHHHAISAGIDFAQGDAVVLMDGDLQDPPEEITKIYQKFNEGYDIVYGIRQNRKDPFFKRMTSTMFWWLLRKFSGVDMPANQTMLRILSRRIIDVLKTMREYTRFMHGLMAWTGFRVATVGIEHGARLRGKSKYNISRLFGLAFHAITSFSTVPLKIATYVGFTSALVSLNVGLYFIFKKIAYDIPVMGYASIIVAIFFIGGLQLLVLGILGEYLGRTYQEVQRRPLYIIEKQLL